jgi:hypothetical protein
MGTLKVWDGTSWQLVAGSGPAGTAPVTSVDGRTGAVSLSNLYVDVTGDTITGPMVLGDGVNFALGLATGTKWGTTASQKQAWWGATPTIQSSGWSATAGYTTDKSFNPQTTTLAEVANVVATLIDTLKTYGMLGP